MRNCLDFLLNDLSFVFDPFLDFGLRNAFFILDGDGGSV